MTEPRGTRQVLQLAGLETEVQLFKAIGPRPSLPLARRVREPDGTAIELVREAKGSGPKPEVLTGVEVGGSFVDLTRELEAIDEEVRDRFRVRGFVPVDLIPADRCVGRYFLEPAGPGAAKVLRLVADAIGDAGSVEEDDALAGIVTWTKSKNPALGALMRVGDALCVIELAFADQLRERPDGGWALAETSGSEREAAERLIEAMTLDSAELLDVAEDARHARRAALVQATLEGAEAPRAGVSVPFTASDETDVGGYLALAAAEVERDPQAAW